MACKLQETVKKVKDIFVAVHSVRYPDSKELDPEQARRNPALKVKKKRLNYRSRYQRKDGEK